MKKIIAGFVILMLGFSCFAQSKSRGNVDVGGLYGYGVAFFDESVNGVKIKNVNANGLGLYVGGTYEFNDYFGIFGDLGFIFPMKTEIEASVNGVLFTLDDYMKAKFVMTDMIGLCGIIPVNEKFKIRLGGGFDFGLMIIKADMDYNGYSVSMSETDLMFGLGLKAIGIYMFNERFGINFGLNGDFYFGGVGIAEAKAGGYKQKHSDSFSRNVNFVRVQVGCTIKTKN